MKAESEAVCGGKKSIVIGGKHGTSSDCVLVCGKDWSTGKLVLYHMTPVQMTASKNDVIRRGISMAWRYCLLHV